MGAAAVRCRRCDDRETNGEDSDVWGGWIARVGAAQRSWIDRARPLTAQTRAPWLVLSPNPIRSPEHSHLSTAKLDLETVLKVPARSAGDPLARASQQWDRNHTDMHPTVNGSGFDKDLRKAENSNP